MYGHIHVIIKDLVISEFSEEKWAMVLHASGYADADVLDTVPHPDAVTFSLLTSLCMITAWSPDEAVEALGHHLIVFSLRSGHQRFLKAQGATLPIFLQNVNSVHRQLEREHPGATFPFLHVRSDQPDRAELRYFSPRRGFGRFVVGVVRAIGAYLYGVDVSFEEAPMSPMSGQTFMPANLQAKSWRMSWCPLPEGAEKIWARPQDARSPSEAGPQEASMPFAALHSAMMDIQRLSKIFGCSNVSCAPSNSQLVQRKLEELSTSKMPEEDLLMRSTTAKTIAAAWSDIHLCQCTRFWETSEGHEEDYQLSQDALFADGFVSHCWAPPDDWDEVMGEEVSYAEVKATTLAVMAKDIALGRDRSLSAWGSITFWVDKACIPQDHEDLKARCVNLLEKFILKCEYTCVLFTWNYLERLWCIYEWACFLISQDFNKIFLQTDVLVQDALLPLYLDSVRNFSLKKAKCHKESDRKLLEQKIHREYVSEEAFEKLMQATVIAFMARSMAYPAGRNPELERRLYTPWVSLAWELHMDDLALALASFHSREFRRMACSGSWLEQSAPDILALPDAKHLEELAAQIDLHTVNSVEYHNVVLEWFGLEVTPILIQQRKLASAASDADSESTCFDVTHSSLGGARQSSSEGTSLLGCY
ncbi:unnamed protein product [Durusdinium trenchii]|uniref:Heme NO-binding domain-containing protein n=1 Tax=Durusdinium trenchii TaxID=1381693 RepID=A0ABP0QLD0_9DINO